MTTINLEDIAKTHPLVDKLPIGNLVIMLLMSIIFALQFLCDPNQIYLADMVLKSASFKAFLMYFWLHTGVIHIVSNLVLLSVVGRSACIKIGDKRRFEVVDD